MKKAFRRPARSLHRAAALVLAVLCLFGLTGCSAAAPMAGVLTALLDPAAVESGFTPQTAEGLCIIAAKRANTRWPQSLPDDLTQQIVSAFGVEYQTDYGRYCARARIPVIVSDSRPTARFLEYELYANTSANLQLQIENAVQQVLTYLQSAECAADDEGADLLAALSEARAALSGFAVKRIVIIDSGVTVSGHLNMAVNDITAGTLEEVLACVDAAAYPALQDFQVTMLNLGNVCGTQDDTCRNSNEYRARLEQLWTEVITGRCGAALTGPIVFAAAAGTDQLYCEGDPAGLPWVAPAVFAVNTGSPVREVYSISSAAVGFLPDSAEFREEELAARVIDEAAVWLKALFAADENSTVYVAGSIAQPSAGVQMTESDVSLARAEAVARLLTAADVDGSRLVIVDTGTRRGSWSAPEADFHADGTPNAAAREHNRQVVLIPSGSEQAAELEALLSASAG
ncbi:MAG: hypothetical protein IJ412_02580 [Oscillospiraceae bacterium]|nr:hypothetical protein [Oscillospiraceae bacterium]